MHDKNKDKKFYITWEISLKWILFWQYRQGLYLEPNQKSMVELFAKIATTYFYMILYDFLICSAFVEIKQTLPYKLAIE